MSEPVYEIPSKAIAEYFWWKAWREEWARHEEDDAMRERARQMKAAVSL